MRIACAAALCLCMALVPVPGYADSVSGVPLPAGARPGDDQAYESSRGFRATVRFYQRHFDSRGALYHAPPIYAYRGVVIARFLSRDPRSSWLAVHVFLHLGHTFIRVIPREKQTSAQPLDPAHAPR